MTLERIPSAHSLVARSNSPYNSAMEMALGLMGYSYNQGQEQTPRPSRKIYQKTTEKNFERRTPWPWDQRKVSQLQGALLIGFD
jgi:hypothetical protein